MGSGLGFGQIVSIRVKTLSNTNLAASSHIIKEKASLPVDVRRSKTLLLKLPTVSDKIVGTFLCVLLPSIVSLRNRTAGRRGRQNARV